MASPSERLNPGTMNALRGRREFTSRFDSLLVQTPTGLRPPAQGSRTRVPWGRVAIGANPAGLWASIAVARSKGSHSGLLTNTVLNGTNVADGNERKR